MPPAVSLYTRLSVHIGPYAHRHPWTDAPSGASAQYPGKVSPCVGSYSPLEIRRRSRCIVVSERFRATVQSGPLCPSDAEFRAIPVPGFTQCGTVALQSSTYPMVVLRTTAVVPEVDLFRVRQCAGRGLPMWGLCWIENPAQPAPVLGRALPPTRQLHRSLSC